MNWIENILEKTKVNAEEKREQELIEEAETVLQVMEFNGTVYVSHRGIPLIKYTSVEQLAEIRNTYITFLQKND